MPVVADIGSGLLAPHPLLPDEPDAATALAQGAALVTASGDKLLGGPQAGLLLGAPGAGAEAVARIRRHPLARAMRVDKLTLAALEATLRGPRPPVRRSSTPSPRDLRAPGRRGWRRRSPTWAPRPATPSAAGRRGRRARTSCCPARRSRCPSASRPRCGRASPPCSAASSTGAACSTCARVAPEDDATLAAAVRACTS